MDIRAEHYQIATTPNAVSVASVVAGERLVCVLCRTSSTPKTYSVADSHGNVWSRLEQCIGTSLGRHTEIWTAEATTTGTCTVTVSTTSGTNASLEVGVLRLDPSVVGDSGSVVSPATSLTHYFANPGIDTADDSIVIGSTVFNAVPSTVVLGSGYSQVLSGSTSSLIRFVSKQFTTGTTNETGIYTTTGTARENVAVLACFIALAPDVVPPIVEAASVTDSTLTVDFDEETTGNSGFTLTASGGPVTLSSPSGSGTSSRSWNLSRQIAVGEVVTLSYIAGDVEDLSSNPLADIVLLSVTNNSTYVPPDPPPPEFTYQWYLNGLEISGATNEQYDVVSSSSAMDGTYTCFVTRVSSGVGKLFTSNVVTSI